MTYNFNGNYINVLEIKAVNSSEGGDPDYPYVLTVCFKDGSTQGVKYKRKKDSEAEAKRIAFIMDECFERMAPMSDTQVKMILSAEIEKVRRDIRTVKRLLLEKEDT